MFRAISFREKSVLERSRHILVSEISIVGKKPEAPAMALLDRALAKAGLVLPAA